MYNTGLKNKGICPILWGRVDKWSETENVKQALAITGEIVLCRNPQPVLSWRDGGWLNGGSFPV